ncbi:MAG: ABC transporter ATP-binding protein [Lentisphaeria bacterium]|nr:ABC transporter ATP-binding protein [Lentisphaeria bacterium]NQZ70154.1 ABC transporter ATP-binding protein [Lentisphaeria bacterium]
MSVLLSINSLSKEFKTEKGLIKVLDDINLEISAGESVSITGPSGSGKSTLLGICAGLEDPSSGTVNLCGELISSISETARSELRLKHVGFIFQSFQLIPSLSALENVTTPAEIAGNKDARSAAQALLDKVGLDDRMHHYPNQLSGGEQQRVALARAFINNPQILFADEPTGNLDAENSADMEDLIFELNEEQQTTLLIVTHDMEMAAKTSRIIKLKGGKIDVD